MISLLPGAGVGFLSQLFPSSMPPLQAQVQSQPELGVSPRVGVVPASQVLVATAHDRIDRVLGKFNVPHQKIDRLRISEPLLAGARYLFVGCGQPLSDRSPQRIAEWVRAGGCLLTTDWMAYHVLEKAFCNERGKALVRYAEPFSAAEDSMVAVTQADFGHATTRAVLGEESPAFWVISKSAYPVRTNEEVQVLARSQALGDEFDGADTLLLRFDYGRGEVVHLVSHWYDQHFDESDSSSERPPSARSMIFERGLPHTTKS